MAETILYLDPWAGVSGDMLLAAFLDTDREDGRLEAELRRTVAGLGLREAIVEVERDVEWGIACTRVRVDDRGVAPLRHLADMETIIAAAPLSDGVRNGALDAVRRLAAVEAAIHGCAVENIHFHEVGAVDTLVDVVGVLALVEALGVDKVAVGSIPVGGGTVEIAHGRMGVPAPATARLLEGFEIVGGPEPRELTTPTGALLVAQLGARQGVMPPLRPERIGYGAGSMKLEHGPNMLRVMIGIATEAGGEARPERDEVVELQTNLDDVSPEVVGYTIRLLREAGALDVWTVPAHMKKDRPGVLLHVLVRLGEEAKATATLFRETGTLGIRRQVLSRHLAARGTVSVVLQGAKVRVKWGKWQGQVVSAMPEDEDAVAASAATGLPLTDVMHLAGQAARELMGLDLPAKGAGES
jgi:pyridinium-3,5-bisthiocarboxylic acid mononucleotide nickel chelatase